ncbi:MAG: hypothetical protein WCF33_16295 [Pseudonocardiaceae bacterium]
MSASDVLGAARSTMLVLVVIEELADSRDGVLTLDGGGAWRVDAAAGAPPGLYRAVGQAVSGVYLVGRREPDQQVP